MTDTASILFSFPPDNVEQLEPAEYDRQIRKFAATLKPLAVSSVVKATENSALLDNLDPARHSLSYLFTLWCHIRTNGDQALRPRSVNNVNEAWRPRGRLWDKAVHFFETFESVQVRYAGEYWRDLLEYLGRVSMVLSQPSSALFPMRTAILRLDPSGGTFTSNHLNFIRLCMESAQYAQAVPLLDCHIHSFPLRSSEGSESTFPCGNHTLSSGYITLRSGLTDKINTLDVQEYFLLGAMAFLGLRKYSDAQLLLDHVLVTPTQNAASGFMLEAYKKLILAGALATGKRPSAPRTCNSTALKTLKSASKAYEHVAEVFVSGDLPRLLAEIEAGLSIWTDDGNLGLVQRLVEDHPKFALLKLQRTYASIPIDRLAAKFNKDEPEMESYLVGLIGGGQLNASVEMGQAAGSPKVLRFYSSNSTGPQARSEQQQFAELAKHAAKTNILTEQVKAADHRIHLSKEYIEDQKRRKSKAQSAMATEEAMDTSWDAKDGIDEDVMGDI